MTDAGRSVVVKLGGSFAFSTGLRDWIDALATCAGRIVIVPGGGPFADAVRSAQSKMGFNDEAAHKMALLAMEQYGRALLSFNTILSDADSEDAIRSDLAIGRVPVWMPARMVSAAADIAPSWDVTSDSLAAWLAGRIGAARLFLVKHVALPTGPARCEDLAATGIIDREFAHHHRASRIPAFLLGAADHGAAAAAIRHDSEYGIALE
jgi:dihydroneopterin aldolase